MNEQTQLFPRGDGMGASPAIHQVERAKFNYYSNHAPTDYCCTVCNQRVRLWTDMGNTVRLCAVHAAERMDVDITTVDPTGYGSEYIGGAMFPAIPSEGDPERLLYSSEVGGDSMVWWRNQSFD